MAGRALSLGPVAFYAFEVPASIAFGGRQRVAVHRLVGGARVVDVVGPDPDEIRFSGCFSGPDASSRCRLLTLLRDSGSEVDLTWDDFYFTVILTQFNASYERPSWIPYRLSCTVVRDETAFVTTPPVSVIEAILATLTAAAAVLPDLALSMDGLRQSIAAPGATTLGSSASGAAYQALSTARSTLGVRLAVEESAMLAVDVTTACPAELLTTRLAQATKTSRSLAGIAAADAFLGQAILALGGVNS
jgi:hypothetical protein